MAFDCDNLGPCIDPWLAGCVDKNGDPYDPAVQDQDKDWYSNREMDHYFPIAFKTTENNSVRKRTARDLIECVIMRATYDSSRPDRTVPIYKGFGPQQDSRSGKEDLRFIIRGREPDRTNSLEGQFSLSTSVTIEIESVDVDVLEKVMDDVKQELYVTGRLEFIENEGIDHDEVEGTRENRHFGILQASMAGCD